MNLFNANFLYNSAAMLILIAILAGSARADTGPEQTIPSEQLPAPEEPAGALSLKQAVMLALVKNPDLKIFSREIHVLEARILQASLLPNPELEIEIENFGGQGNLRDFDSAETTIQLSQVIELAGKRSKRKGVASLERDLGEWNYKVKRAEILARVTRAFVETLAAQEQVALKQETVDLAKQVSNTVAERVRAGKVSALEETRANVSYARRLIELERAEHRLEAARKGLASLWGNPNPVFEKLSGRLDQIHSVPSFQDLHTTDNPEIARWDAEIKQKQAAVRMEKAGRVPDVTLGGGWRHFKESDDEAFIMSLSVPLPLFDRNQGSIQEARQRLQKVTEEKRSAELNVSNALSEAYERLSSAYAEASALKEKVLPGAQRTFDATQEGYSLGKFDYLRLLDAQQTLFEVRDQYIETLAAYHKALTEVEQLIGGPMNTVTAEEGQNREGVNSHE